MPRYDFRSPRLYVDAPLAAGAAAAARRARRRTTCETCMRLKAGDGVLVFNGRDGEWRASLADGGKRSAALVVGEQTRPQTAPPDLHYLFAPLKHARLDYMVQKAVEMGASRLQPVLDAAFGQVAAHQSRAHARQRDRGRRAMRHPHRPGDRRADRVRSHDRGARSGARAGVLRRGRRRAGSGRGARGRAQRRPSRCRSPC